MARRSSSGSWESPSQGMSVKLSGCGGGSAFGRILLVFGELVEELLFGPAADAGFRIRA